MSWQHLNQPQGWIGVISLSLSLCCRRRGSWILAHLPALITMFFPADLAHLRQKNLVSAKLCHCSSGKPHLASPRGPCLHSCMCICGNKWTDALHAARLGLTMSRCIEYGVGRSVLSSSFASSACVCKDVSIKFAASCSYDAVCNGDCIR